jgi:hypothetical protein
MVVPPKIHNSLYLGCRILGESRTGKDSDHGVSFPDFPGCGIADDARPGGPAAQTSAQSGTRISCHAALDEATYAAFFKESRMKFAKATKFHRKSGEGLGTNPEMI